MEEVEYVMTQTEIQAAFDRWCEDADENPADFEVKDNAAPMAETFLDYLAETRCAKIGL